MSTTKGRRAIGIARVSVEGRRTEERLYSYDEQAAAIETSCRREGHRLLYVGRERNVSGGADLVGRPELLAAVERVESGDADLIVVAYFDRFFRSLAVQHEVVARIEAAGGELLALDHGRLTNGTAAQRMSSNIMGAVSQFYREQAGEKSRAGQAAAVARGAIPWARIPWGYVRRDDGTIEPVPDLVPLVREVFDRRAAGESMAAIRRWLREHGVERTARGVQQMLQQRLYIGELHFKDLVNLHACEPVVDRDVFDRVQRMVVARGPQPKANRLLSRLRIIRCGSCGSPLGTMKLPREDDRAIYRCSSQNIDCPMHVTIDAGIADSWVWEQVKTYLGDAKGRASAGDQHARAVAVRDEAQGRLDQAVRTFTDAGLLSEASAVDTLRQLRAARDVAQADLDELPAAPISELVRVDDDLPRDVRRELIKASVKSVTVAPARGTGLRGARRLSVEFRG